ncbi:MAG: hypothetical protein ACXQT4_03200 [Methanotrichaceae archaeon]
MTVEASGYLFRDIEALLKGAEKALEEFRTGAPEAYNKHKEDLTNALQELDKICSRYKDDAEACIIKDRLSEFLNDIDSGNLILEQEIQHLDRIIERVHHLVDWRKLSTAAGYDLHFSSRRKTREDVETR